MSNIKASLNHLVFLIHDYDKNIVIYKNLFDYFGFQIVADESYGLGVVIQSGLSLWIMRTSNETINHRDANGLNHLALSVSSKEDVDTFSTEFLKENNIECLFDTPKARPDFTGDQNTYYQVMFELPGSVLFEVVFTDYNL